MKNEEGRVLMDWKLFAIRGEGEKWGLLCLQMGIIGIFPFFSPPTVLQDAYMPAFIPCSFIGRLCHKN